MNPSNLGLQGARVDVVIGAAGILECLPQLRAAALAWGQAAEAAELPYLLSVPVVPERRPLLILLWAALSPDAAPPEPQLGELLGAVLVFAYGARILGERLLAHPDRSGRRCVFGPARERTSVAMIASRAMLDRGAVFLRLYYRTGDEPADGAEGMASTLRRQRAIASLHMLGAETAAQLQLRSAVRRLELPLEPELDETLRRVGRRTRKNLRQATRHSAHDLGAIFELDAAISSDELKQLNAACTHPVRDRVLRWRLRVAKETPGAFLAGLRTASGEWMGVAGGRRVGDAIVLDWQINVRRFAPYSVSLVMRGYLMAHFGKHGVQSMRIEGGTVHALVNAFRTATVYTLQMKRPSLALRVFERILTAWFPGRAMTRNLFESAGETTGQEGETRNRARQVSQANQ